MNEGVNRGMRDAWPSSYRFVLLRSLHFYGLSSGKNDGLQMKMHHWEVVAPLTTVGSNQSLFVSNAQLLPREGLRS